MSSTDDYEAIAALEAENNQAQSIIRALTKERDLALDEIERANTELTNHEEQVEKKQKEVDRLRGVIEELRTDVGDERRTTAETVDSLQKAWADLKKLRKEYEEVVNARNEAETVQFEIKQQLDAARDQLEKTEAELANCNALQEATREAQRAHSELDSEINNLRGLDNDEGRRMVVLSERNATLIKENFDLNHDNKLLKNAFQVLKTEQLTPEAARELEQLDTALRPTETSLAEELDGYDYGNVDYDCESIVDSPIAETFSIGTQTEGLSSTMSCGTQYDVSQPTVAISTQTETFEAKATPTISQAVSSQTDYEASQAEYASASTQTDMVDKTVMADKTYKLGKTTFSTPKEKGRDVPTKPLSWMIMAVLILCWVFTTASIVGDWQDADGAYSSHDYNYGAYGNKRYLFNIIPIASDVGGFEPMAGFSSRLIASLEEWSGVEHTLLY